MLRRYWREIWDPAGGWPAALGFLALWYFLLQGANRFFFEVAISPAAVATDLGAHLLLGALLYAIARGPGYFFAPLALLLTILHCGNAAKVAILGGPVTPDDLRALPNLFLLLPGWRQAFAAAIGAAAVVGLLGMPDLRKRRAWIAAMLLCAGTTALTRWPSAITVAMDNTFGNVVWDQRGNFERRGLLIHLTQESARFLARARFPPTKSEVTAAAAVLKVKPFLPANGFQKTTAPLPQRNVHLIVLESFWDPMQLEAAALSADPLDPRFRALWLEADKPQALSPVFGGYTANAEFEALCGFPVMDDAVFFEGRLRQDAPCLPRHFAESGYTTIASHPNVPIFWNRIHAYRRMGFQHYFSLHDFTLDDMNREFLSDASLYRQVLERIRPLREQGIPVLNYILTFFGHLDYPLGPDRPKVITAPAADPLVEAYANTVYYKSRELMDFLSVLRQNDPDGLIVIFGDHLPFLGNNFGGYTESGLLAPDRGEFTDIMFKKLTSTPLLIIDGSAGPLPTGDLPLYNLPDLILNLLHDKRPSIMAMTRTPPGVNIRPLPGMQLITYGDNTVATCRGGNSDPDWCQEVDRWLEAVEILSEDIYAGRTHFFAADGGDEISQPL
ncbi:LTA synthase family protein [Thiovibrio sp. JS02]